MSASDVDTLARTIWGEARGEMDPGMAAVAWAVMNRVSHPRWWGNDISNVCTTPWQFSCWNSNDLNRPKLLAVTAESDPYFAKALGIAGQVISGQIADPTDGATSYFDRRMPEWPRWSVGREPCAVIGHHLFYRDA